MLKSIHLPFVRRNKPEPYDESRMQPVIKCSICNGEQVAGFKDLRTGEFDEVMLIRSTGDLKEFRDRYGLSGEIEKIY